MAVRDDLSIRYDLSPRVIFVEEGGSQDTELTIQDLHDTVRNLEDEPGALQFVELIQTSGGQELGGGVTVALTAKLLNAIVAFAARKNWTSTGTATTADADGLFLYDSAASFTSDGTVEGSWVVNVDDRSQATVLKVIDDNTLLLDGLGGGINDDWEIGDTYLIKTITQCNVSGGNLTAVDDPGTSFISSILPTAGTQVVRTASSSATALQSLAIQFMSFQNGVWVDENNVTGRAVDNYTEDGAGTQRKPCLKLSDAMVLEGIYNFGQINVLGDLVVDAGANYDGITFMGRSRNKTLITVTSAASVVNCEFHKCRLAGTLDGGSVLEDCCIGDLDYVDGLIRHCSIGQGEITLSGVPGSVATFQNCDSSLPGEDCPYIHVGSGTALQIRGYHGGLCLDQKTGPEHVTIDFTTGRLILWPSYGGTGNITVRGPATIQNYSTLTENQIFFDSTINNEFIAEHVWAELALLYEGDSGSFGEIMNVLRKIPLNELEEVEGNPGLFRLKDDDDSVLFEMELRDKNGNGISLSTGVPAKRTKATWPPP